MAGEAVNGQEAIARVAELSPDVILMDVRMPVLDGLQATRQITAAGGGAPRVLVLTTFDLDDYVYEALRSGASGFLLKDASAGELAEAVRVVGAGGPRRPGRGGSRSAGRSATWPGSRPTSWPGNWPWARCWRASCPPGVPAPAAGDRPAAWFRLAAGALSFADVYAGRQDRVACLANLCQAVLATAQGRLAAAGEWVLNEKRLTERAGFDAIQDRLAQPWPDLGALVSDVRARLGLRDGVWAV